MEDVYGNVEKTHRFSTTFNTMYILIATVFASLKHHCRRCGGIFCGSCTQQRMVLRGQGSLKSAPRDENEVLNHILGQASDKVPSRQRSFGISSSSSNSNFDEKIRKIVSNDKPNVLRIDLRSTTQDELRKQALEEKKKHKILK
ncbi:hypothetical protein JHK82_055812 [Glycine max]|nr:hypothetical protein JHK85_056640 [Glycine max]KAG5074447.1 hypothetical protein JHK84_055678 [Glycine max]KAG5077117.1 hypothetical protein JHK82_055812 [Glycine max]